MSSVKDHYDNHLGDFYSWMTGNLETNVDIQVKTFKEHGLEGSHEQTAIDLGSGHGIQTLALRKIGYKVVAIDFNKQLLDELKKNISDNETVIIEDDMLNFKKYEYHPNIITCCGDTLAHLGSFDELSSLINDCYCALNKEGILYVTFRDYSVEIKDTERFIPVKQDQNRILTCFLEYFQNYVRVTDILYENMNGAWCQKVSSYEKLRISFEQIQKLFIDNGFRIKFTQMGRMNIIIGVK